MNDETDIFDTWWIATQGPVPEGGPMRVAYDIAKKAHEVTLKSTLVTLKAQHLANEVLKGQNGLLRTQKRNAERLYQTQLEELTKLRDQVRKTELNNRGGGA